MPKTMEQEKLEGCPGHRPLNDRAPVPDRSILDPPRWLGRISKRAYYDLVQMVGPDGMNVMANSDRLALVMVCEAYEEWRYCKREIEIVGRYWLCNGNMKRHPAVTDMQNAWNRIMTGLGKFGLTPYERQKVHTLGDKKEKSREDKIAERRAAAALAAKKRHLTAVND